MDRDLLQPVRDLESVRWLPSVLTNPGNVSALVPPGYETYVRIPIDRRSPLWDVRDVLARHTAAGQECFYAAWEGWPLPESWRRYPTLSLPDREYYVFSAKFDDAQVVAIEFACAVERQDAPGKNQPNIAKTMRLNGVHVVPNLWWPKSREWFFASEVDADAIYVGGSTALSTDLLSSTAILGATTVDLENAVTIEVQSPIFPD